MPQALHDIVINDPVTGSTAAKILNRPESTVRAWRQRGKFHNIIRTESGLTLYSRAELEQLRREDTRTR